MALAAAFAKPAGVAPLVTVSALAPAAVEVATAVAAGKKRKRPTESAEGAPAAGAPAAGEPPAGAPPAKAAKASAGADAASSAHKAAKKLTRKQRAERSAQPRDDPERLARTLFVGNVPLSATNKSLFKTFSAWVKEVVTGAAPAAAGAAAGGAAAGAASGDGDEAMAGGAASAAGAGAEASLVESVRLRNVPIEAVPVAPGSDYRTMIKAATVTRKMDASVKDSMNAFVVLRSADHVKAALTLNGRVLEGHHLRVDKAGDGSKPVKYDHKRTVFVGNLPYDASEETLRGFLVSRLSLPGGTDAAVESVRIVRDRETGKGRGIAFVLFRERAHVVEALTLHGTAYEGREVRVVRCSADGAPQFDGRGFGKKGTRRPQTTATGGAPASMAAGKKAAGGGSKPKAGGDASSSSASASAAGGRADRPKKEKHAARKAKQAAEAAAAAGSAGAAAPAPAVAAAPVAAPAAASAAKKPAGAKPAAAAKPAAGGAGAASAAAKPASTGKPAGASAGRKAVKPAASFMGLRGDDVVAGKEGWREHKKQVKKSVEKAKQRKARSEAATARAAKKTAGGGAGAASA